MPLENGGVGIAGGGDGGGGVDHRRALTVKVRLGAPITSATQARSPYRKLIVGSAVEAIVAPIVAKVVHDGSNERSEHVEGRRSHTTQTVRASQQPVQAVSHACRMHRIMVRNVLVPLLDKGEESLQSKREPRGGGE
eukprot:scaffold186516_cov28-Tisochrysis_lutea.AAC.2